MLPSGLALSQFELAERCLVQAGDMSGLLLLYSAQGNAAGLEQLAARAGEQGKNNVAFLCLFLLAKPQECIELLVRRYASPLPFIARPPERSTVAT